MREKHVFGFIVIIFLFAYSNVSFADWKVIYTTTDLLDTKGMLGYKPLKLYEGIRYGVVVKVISGEMDIDVLLFNPGDKLVAEGIKKSEGILLLFTPDITESEYKIVIRNKKDKTRLRLTLAHE